MCEFKPPEKSDDPDYQCRHPARQDGLCIFHLLKTTEEQKQAMAQEARTIAEATEKEFRQAFSKLLEDEEKNLEADVCDFRYFRFPAIDLSGRRFAKPLLLTEATFSGEANFKEVTFSGVANFERATFSELAYFRDVTFKGAACFWGATFSELAYFWGATFSGEARFEGATFRREGMAYFERATFSGVANFGGATFNGEADFVFAIFREVASFVYATFSGVANFGGAAFNGEADSGMAHVVAVPKHRLPGRVSFVSIPLGVVASFRGATFSGVANFGGAAFNGAASFEEATFSGAASFRGETFKDVCDFISVTLDEKSDEKSRVVFEKANLEQASFLDTNLERIHFSDVKWPRKGRRKALWDEFLHKGEQPDYEKVAENYRQLVLNYEAKRDFDTAEDFHIGEMEMRRKKKWKKAEDKAAKAKSRGMKLLWRWWGTIRERTNGYSIYKFLSNYGTSYLHGFLVLLVGLVLFSGIFLCTGLKPSKEHKDSLHDINYELCLHTACQRASWQRKVSDSGRTIVFTLSLLTLQKERLYEPANVWTQFWICIAVPILAGQTALVLFAIRRRFKR
jgi:uncharacterized protein YjbI with pentapeptide repeats